MRLEIDHKTKELHLVMEPPERAMVGAMLAVFALTPKRPDFAFMPEAQYDAARHVAAVFAESIRRADAWLEDGGRTMPMADPRDPSPTDVREVTKYFKSS